MKHWPFLIGGLVFGFGLAISTMAQPEVVLAFLQLEDFGLLLVLGAAATITGVTYWLLPRIRKKPLLEKTFDHKDSPLTKKTIIGAVIFGLGWGLSGLCPGSAIASLGVGNAPVLWGLAGMFLGAYAYGRTQSK